MCNALSNDADEVCGASHLPETCSHDLLDITQCMTFHQVDSERKQSHICASMMLYAIQHRAHTYVTDSVLWLLTMTSLGVDDLELRVIWQEGCQRL